MDKLNTVVGSICLSDIPKERIKKAENGKVYVNIALYAMRKEDDYGNHYVASCAPKQEERKDDVNYLVGKFRVLPPKNEPNTPEDIDNLPPVDVNEIPF